MLFGSFSVKSRPRSKHSSFSSFHAFMILPKNSPKTSKITHTWKHEKDECFERGLVFTENLEKTKPRSKHSSFSCSRAPFWPYLGLILAPSWLLLGSSWPHLGPSWPHLGPMLASSWPSWPFLAPSWPLLGPVLTLLAALGPILALGSLGSLGPHVGQLERLPESWLSASSSSSKVL